MTTRPAPILSPAQSRLIDQANAVRQDRSARYSGLTRGGEINAMTLTGLLRASGLIQRDAVVPPRLQMLWQAAHKLNRAAGPNPDEDDFRDAYNYLQGAYELYLQEFHSGQPWLGNAPSPDGWGDEPAKQGQVFERESLYKDGLTGTVSMADGLKDIVPVMQPSDIEPRLAMFTICSCGRSYPLKYTPAECKCGVALEDVKNRLIAKKEEPPTPHPADQNAILLTRQEDFEKSLEQAKPGEKMMLVGNPQHALFSADQIFNRTGRRPLLRISHSPPGGVSYIVVSITEWKEPSDPPPELQVVATEETPEGKAEDRRAEDQATEPPLPKDQKWTIDDWFHAMADQDIAKLPAGTRLRYSNSSAVLARRMDMIRDTIHRAISYSLYPAGARGNEVGPGILWIRKNEAKE